MKRPTPEPPAAFDIWREIFTTHRAALWSAANALVTCSCTDTVLERAREEAGAMDVPGAFRYGYALRAVVKAAIAHALQCRELPCDSHDSPSAAPKSAHIKSLPTPERFVYFLIEILGYPRRERFQPLPPWHFAISTSAAIVGLRLQSGPPIRLGVG